MQIIVRVLTLSVLFVSLAYPNALFAEDEPHRYEVELLDNPNPGKKDTREVNSVIVFEKDSVKIVSRRNRRVFKEFRYGEVKAVEHSYSRSPMMTDDASALALALFTGIPYFLIKKEKNWLTITAENDFAVLKLENDNFRQIRAEFQIRRLQVKTVSEN